MKNKFLLIIIFCLLTSNYIYRKIWHIKYNIIYRNKNNRNIHNEKLNKPYKIEATILENNFTELIINKGSNHNIKINMVCEGENGFIGLISEVNKDYSIVKTFWYINWKLIVIDGNNNYGYLNSNGYFLYILTSPSSNSVFLDDTEIYFVSNKEKSSIGIIKHIKKNIYKVYPKENILHVKKIYIK